VPRAFIIGGSGQIGRATAERLVSSGWEVVAASRSRPEDPISGVRYTAVDRQDSAALADALADGADLLLDTQAFDVDDAAQLVEVAGDVGQIVAISSASVYRDADGRTLDEARTGGFPAFPVPILEDQPTVEPGPATYSTRKVAMEQRILNGTTIPVTILRPCAVHGVGSRSPREWYVVKRLLDGRKRIALAYEGKSRFHTTAATNIAALIETITGTRASGVLNVIDPDAPQAIEIVRLICGLLGRDAQLVLLPDCGRFPPPAGGTPWSVQRPIVCSDAAARRLGYVPAETYGSAVAATCAWLARSIDPDNWQQQLPGLAAYGFDLFDYESEDAAMGPA
jgi:nucleoside-diphosphate-sugar epimerase